MESPKALQADVLVRFSQSPVEYDIGCYNMSRTETFGRICEIQMHVLGEADTSPSIPNE